MNKFTSWWCNQFKNTPIKSTDNLLIIRVDKQGKILIDFDINQWTDKDCENFGTMLFYMNEGVYIQTILDLFSFFAKKDTKYINFMNKTIKQWSDLVANNNTNAEPVVSPSRFYQTTGVSK